MRKSRVSYPVLETNLNCIKEISKTISFQSLENLKLQISEDQVEFFSSHLEELKSDIDVFQINVLNWIIDHFEADFFK